MSSIFETDKITDMAARLTEKHPLYTMIPDVPAYQPLKNQAFDIALEIIKGTRSSERLTLERKLTLYKELPDLARRFIEYTQTYERYEKGLESRYAMWVDVVAKNQKLPDKKDYEPILREIALDILLGTEKISIEKLIKKENSVKRIVNERRMIEACIRSLSK